MKIGLVVHAGRADSVASAAQAARVLTDHGVDIVVARPFEGPEELEEQIAAPILEPQDFADGLGLVVSFGGDGTFLRAAHLCRDQGIPVLGVNLGRLGFLAEIEADDLASALRAVADDGFVTEDRATLDVSIEDAHGQVIGTGWALNEVSVEKTARQRLLLMDVHVGDSLFAKVPADALVIATSTGSTAYALSAGGPIVSPHLEATLVTPVAPHSLFDRTLVCSPEEAVRVHVLPDQAPAVVSCDGRDPRSVPEGGVVVARGGGTPVRLARVGLLDFYSLVRRKFNLH